MKLKYVGPFDAVDVPALNAVVKQGEAIDVTGALAEEFLSRDDWVSADKKDDKKAEKA